MTVKENQRYRSDPQAIVGGLIQAGKICEIGDLIGLVGGYCVSGRNFDTSGAGGATIAADFKAVFLGVLISGATSGRETKDTQCLVGWTGVYEYDIAPANLTVDQAPGALLGAVATATTMAAQELTIVGARAGAIAQLARQVRAGKSLVSVAIFSSIMGNKLA